MTIRDISLSQAKTDISRRQALRFAVGMATAATAGSALAACSNPGPRSNSSPSNTIKIITSYSTTADSPEANAMRELCAKPLGLTIEFRPATSDNLLGQVLAQTRNDDPPDLIWWVAQRAGDVMGNGVPLQALDAYIVDEDSAAFYPQGYQAGVVQDELYALGFDVGTRGIVYRQDYVEEAGLEVPSAWSLDEFGEWAASLTRNGHYGFAFEARQGDPRFTSNFLPLLWSTGADLVTRVDGEWEIGFDPQQMETILRFYSDLAHKWRATPADIATWGYEQTDTGYARGLLASYSSGVFVNSTVAEYPDTLANTRVAPLPNAGQPTTYWEEKAFLMNGQSKNKDNAWRLMAEMRSEPVQEYLVDADQGFLSIRKNVNEGVTDPVRKGFVDQLQFGRAPEPVNTSPIMAEAVSPAIVSMLLKELSPSAAVSLLVEGLERVLPQLNQGQ